MILRHERKSILNGGLPTDSHGVIDHTVFCSLHNGHLACLLLDAHVLVDDTDTTFASNGNSHGGFGNRIHGCCHERNLKLNVA